MIRCPDNQINASFIDILRIKWLVFYCARLSYAQLPVVPLQASKAPADYQPAPGRTDGVPERHQRQWIINPSLQICAWNRSWIKGLGKNPQKSELIHWRQCLLSGATEACSLGLRETPACIHVIQRLSQPRVACWHGFRQNSQKTECVFTRCPTGGRRKKLRVYTASEAKGLRRVLATKSPQVLTFWFLLAHVFIIYNTIFPVYFLLLLGFSQFEC